MIRRLALLLPLLLPAFAAADTASGSGTGTSSTDQLVGSLFGGCWACGAINTMGAIGFDFADKAYQSLSSGMTILVGLGLALWLLLFAARLLLPFGPPPASGHWNAGAVKLFKCAVVLAFLAGSGPFWDYVFTPIFSVGVGIASQLATTGDTYESTYGGTPASVPNGQVDYCKGTLPSPKITLSSEVQPLYTAFTQIDCPLSHIQGAFGKGILIGVAVMGKTTCTESLIGFATGQRSIASFILAGLVLVVVFGWGFLVFPILLIDAMARVILVAATSPLAIASILFKPTARIAERSVWSLIHCGFTLMFGSVIAGIGKAVIAYVLGDMATTVPGAPQLNDWSSLSATLENSCSSGFTVDFTTASFYELVGTAIITTFMMRRASHLAGELAGNSGGSGLKEALGAMSGAAGRAVDRTVVGLAARAGKSLSRQVSGREE